jgi:hypothetical protein
MILFQLLFRREDGFQHVHAMADRRKVLGVHVSPVADLEYTKLSAIAAREGAKNSFGATVDEPIVLDLTGYDPGTNQGPILAALEAVVSRLRTPEAYKVPSFLFAEPNGAGGQRVVSGISPQNLKDYVGQTAMRWALSARVGEYYNTEGTYVLIRTA